MSITDFLNARIAEDETAARAAVDNVAPDEWESELGSLNLWPQDIAHWNRHDPARVLAECAAKRAIVEEHQAMKDDGWVSGESHGYLWCSSCGSVDYDSPVPYPCPTLRALAAIYADHDDYQDEWKVGA